MAEEDGQEAVFEWNFENTTELITFYETFPCLYGVRSKDYKNRDARDKAMAEKLKHPGFWVLPTGCSMPRNRFNFLAILESKFCAFSPFLSTSHNYSDNACSEKR